LTSEWIDSAQLIDAYAVSAVAISDICVLRHVQGTLTS